MNNDFFVDITSLFNAISKLEIAKEDLDDLYTSLESIDVSKMNGLAGKSTFKANKKTVLKIYSGYDESVCAIYGKLKNLKGQMSAMDGSVASLFQMLEEGLSTDEFGSFVTGEMALDEAKLSTIKSQYDEYANIDQSSLTQTQWDLINSNNAYLNEQIDSIEAQVAQLSAQMYQMIDTWGPAADTTIIEAQIAVLGEQKKNLQAFVYNEDETYLQQVGSEIVDAFGTVWENIEDGNFREAFSSGKDLANLLNDTGSEITDKARASVANFGIATIVGVGTVAEALVDATYIVASGITTIGTAAVDVVNGIANSDWDFSATKTGWDVARSFVSREWVSEGYDWFNDTNLGQKLDEKSFDFFSSDGTGTEFGKGLGYSLGVIGTTVATCGAATPAMLAATAGAAGFGKCTSEAWNNNSMTLDDGLGNVVNVSLNFDDCQQLQDLDLGQSVTFDDFSIAKNANGDYTVYDALGNQYFISQFDYTGNAEGLVKGTVNAGWEALQYGIGAKIGTSTFGLNSQAAISGVRMGLDAVTGAAEVPFQAAQMVLFDDKSWNEAWNNVGGWQAVGVQTALGGTLSFVGEIGDAFKKADIDVNPSKADISPARDISGDMQTNRFDGDSTKIIPSSIRDSSQAEIGNIKNEILENMPPDLDDLAKCRYLYMELNKRVSYDHGYLSSPYYTKESGDIYRKDMNLTFDNLVGNKVVCVGWSNLYKELLLDVGFEPEQVKIRGVTYNGAHAWVEIGLDDSILRADATAAFNHSIDISASKSGCSTNGFIFIPKELSGKNIHGRNSHLYENLPKDDSWLRKIDEDLGYATNGKYFNETVDDLSKDFYSPSLVEKIFGTSKGKALDNKYDFFWNLPIPENMNAYDADCYLKQVKYALFGSGDTKLDISTCFRPAKDSNVPLGITSVLKNDGSKLNCKIIDDELGVVNLEFKNYDEYITYMRNFGCFVLSDHDLYGLRQVDPFNANLVFDASWY